MFSIPVNAEIHRAKRRRICRIVLVVAALLAGFGLLAYGIREVLYTCTTEGCRWAQRPCPPLPLATRAREHIKAEDSETKVMRKKVLRVNSAPGLSPSVVILIMENAEMSFDVRRDYSTDAMVLRCIE